jgi:hypothetical protein
MNEFIIVDLISFLLLLLYLQLLIKVLIVLFNSLKINLNIINISIHPTKLNNLSNSFTIIILVCLI